MLHMDKIIYIKESTLRELKEQVTFYEFKNKLIYFLKDLLNDPINSSVDNFFKDNGISKSLLIKMLLKKNIIERSEKFEEEDGKSIYKLQYKIPKANFKTKVKRLYSYFFERDIESDGIDNMINDEVIAETDCAGVGAIGDGSDSSGQFLQPLTKSIYRRNIYKPKTNKKDK